MLSCTEHKAPAQCTENCILLYKTCISYFCNSPYHIINYISQVFFSIKFTSSQISSMLLTDLNLNEISSILLLRIYPFLFKVKHRGGKQNVRECGRCGGNRVNYRLWINGLFCKRRRQVRGWMNVLGTWRRQRQCSKVWLECGRNLKPSVSPMAGLNLNCHNPGK